MRGGATRPYPSFPEIEADIGYNPARFLDVRAVGDGIGETSDLTTAWALIRGIQDIATIRAWITVEVELGRGRNGGPRKKVIKRLNRRQLQIKETTETTPSAENTAQDSQEKANTTNDSEGDESTTADGATSITASVAASDIPSTPTSMSTSADPALATDGGTGLSTPRCPDCRAELQREEVADEVAYWCGPCGGFREPAEAATEMEAR